MAGVFQNFRRPVVYILDQELRKRDLRNKIKLDTAQEGQLSMYPIELIRDPVTQKVTQCLHGVAPNQWTEDFIRVGGKVTQIITTYPDGTSDTIILTRDPKIHYIDEI